MIQWLLGDSFSPGFLPRSWAHPVFGYLLAILLQVLSVVVLTLLVQAFPSFRFPSTLDLLVVLLVALGWGTGPSILATITGAVLLILFILPPTFSLEMSRPEDVIGVCLYVGAGLAVSVLASQVQRSRYRALALAQRLEAIVEAIPDSVVIYDRQGRSVQYNQAARATVPAEGQYITLADMPRELSLCTVNGEPLRLEEVPLARALQGETITGMEMSISYRTTNDQQRHFVAVSAAPLRGINASIDGAVTVTRDVSALRQAERSAAELARQLEAIFTAMTDAMTVYDRDGQILRMNPAARVLFSLADWPEPDLSRPISERMALFTLLDGEGHPLPPELWPARRLLSGEVLTGTQAVDLLIQSPDGRTVLASVSGAPLYDADGTIIGAVTIARDMTERRRLEAAGREAARARDEQARLLEAIVESIPDALCVNDSAGAPLLMNSAGRALLGDERLLDVRIFAAHLGKDIEVFDENGHPLSFEQWPVSRILAGEVLTSATAADIRYCAPNGRETEVSITGGPIRGEDGRIIGAVTAARDVTERRTLERRVRTAEREEAERASQLEAIFEAITDLLLVYDKQGQLIRVNEAARQFDALPMSPEQRIRPASQRMSGYLVRDTKNQLLSEEHIPVFRILKGEVLSSTYAEDVRLSLPDGRDVQLSVTGAPIRDRREEITGAVLICRDVTERRALEQRTQAALEALLAMAQTIVQSQDPAQGEAEREESGTTRPLPAVPPTTAVVTRLAELTRNVLGCKRLSLMQVEPGTERLRPLSVVGLSPEQEQQWWAEQEQQDVRLSDGSDPTLVRRLRAGEVLLLDLTQPPYRDQPNPYGIRQMLIAPMLLDNSLVGFISLDYGGLDHVYTQQEMDLTSAVAKLATMVLERERLLQERAKAQAQTLALQEANRRMNAFLSIAGHEIRTPLTSIKANVQLTQRTLTRVLERETLSESLRTALNRARDFLERANRQVNIQSRLVRDLLDVSRIETDQLTMRVERCDLVPLVRQTIEDQRPLPPERRIDLVIDTPETVNVLVDPDRIGQVIGNYLSNALKYSEGLYPVEVRLERDSHPESVRLSVRDQGPGLSPSEQQRIWERFYRVPGIEVKSGSGVGLGLGLHISRIIIEQLGGQVGVESKEGEGSTFWFTLPIA
jgi:PAS domain S-box-containing protein